MQRILLFIFIYLPLFIFSQNKITIVSAKDSSPIPNANIYYNDQSVGKTDATGSITLKSKYKAIEIEADNYEGTIAKVNGNSVIKLQPSSEKSKNIQKIVLQYKSDDRALKILDEAEKRFKDNSPNSLESYNFKSYSKVTIDLDKDSIEGYKNFVSRRSDSLATVPQKKLKQSKGDIKDSLMTEDFIGAAKDSQFFMWEKAQLHQFSKKYGEKVSVLDSKISGLKNPMYEFMALSFSYLGRTPRVLQSENRKMYRFFLTDTIEINGRKNYVISYRDYNTKKEQNKRKFSGAIYIDTETYGISKIESKNKKSNEGAVLAIWKYISGKWFLESENIRLIAGNQVFPTEEKKKNQNKEKDTKDKKNTDKKFGNYLYIKNKYFDFKTNIAQKSNDFSGYTYEVKNADGSLLEKYRTEELTEREKNTYKTIDSLSTKLKLEKKVNQLTGLLKGNIRLGMVDLDLLKIIDYNKYEGLRLGAGAKLNEKFNRWISPDAYFGYGFKDHTWKYGAGVDFRLSEKRNSVFRIEYLDDVSAVGKLNRGIWSNGLSLDNFATDIQNGNFYSYKGFGTSFLYDISNTFSVKIGSQYQKQKSMFGYVYNQQENNYTDFKTSIALMYSPNDKNIMTPSGKFTFESGFPKISAILEQGIPSLGGNMRYTRLELYAIHRFKTKLGVTVFRLNGGISTTTAPIWKNFAMNGMTDFYSDNILTKISLETPHSFYTMPSGSYFADKFAALFINQSLPFTFRTIGKNVSKIELTYSSAIGDFKNPAAHQFNFVPLNHYYQEAGFVWRNFLGTRYSLGMNYRFGHYQSSNFVDNLGIVIGLL